MWARTYAVCVYPVSILSGVVWGLTLAIGMQYKIYEHPDSPYQYAMGSLVVLLNGGLATFVTVKIYRRLWPAGSS